MHYRSILSLRSSAFLLGATCLAGAAFANDYTANFTASAPTIDGVADSLWSNASPAATGFVDFSNVATQSTQQSRVRMLWDSSKLYVLFEADDNEIVAPATADDVGFDFGTPQDTAEIFLDPALVQSSGAGDDRIYHIAVNPADGAYTWTEAGQNQTVWNLGPDSDLAFSATASGWNIEMAIAWTDLNSTNTLSPGTIVGPPREGVIWGIQLGRLHGGGSPANNTVASKWEPTASSFRLRPFALLKFAGGPAATAPDLSTKVTNYTTSFESPTYTAGSSPNGIEIWSVPQPAIFTADSAIFNTGAQSIRADVTAGSGTTLVGSKQSDNTVTPQYLQYAVRLPLDIPGNGYRHVLYINGIYGDPSAPSNGVAGQIWFTSNNTVGANNIDVYNYGTLDGPSTSTAAGVRFPGQQAYDVWSYVTVKVDPVAKTYEVWINDTKLVRPTGEDYYVVRNKDTFLQFTHQQFYNKNYGTEPVYFDDVIYAEDQQPSKVEDWQLF